MTSCGVTKSGREAEKGLAAFVVDISAMHPCMKGNHAVGALAGEGACYAPLLGVHKGSSQALGPFSGTPILHSCCQTGESPGKGHYGV